MGVQVNTLLGLVVLVVYLCSSPCSYGQQLADIVQCGENDDANRLELEICENLGVSGEPFTVFAFVNLEDYQKGPLSQQEKVELWGRTFGYSASGLVMITPVESELDSCSNCLGVNGNTSPNDDVSGKTHFRFETEIQLESEARSLYLASLNGTGAYEYLSGIQVEVEDGTIAWLGLTAVLDYVNSEEVSEATFITTLVHNMQMNEPYATIVIRAPVSGLPMILPKTELKVSVLWEIEAGVGLTLCTTIEIENEDEFPDQVLILHDSVSVNLQDIEFEQVLTFFRDESGIEIVRDSMQRNATSGNTIFPGASEMKLDCAIELRHNDSSSSDWWIWTLVGVGVMSVILVILFVVLRRRKSSRGSDFDGDEKNGGGVQTHTMEDRENKLESVAIGEGTKDRLEPTFDYSAHGNSTGTESTGVDNKAGSLHAFEQVIIPKEKVKIGGLIGSGGFADVHKGFYGGEEVAIKVLKKATKDIVGKSAAETYFETQDAAQVVNTISGAPSNVKTEAINADILQEIATYERIRHPHVAHFYGICLGNYESDPVWMVMELAPRGTLQDLLVSSSLDSFTWIDRQRMCYFVSLGMEYLHSPPRNIFHADLKPANIILSDSMLPKVIDFGIAAFYDTSEDTGLRARKRGTLMYMAPEILNATAGNELQSPQKADVYSFGMLIFVLAHQTDFGRVRKVDSMEREVLLKLSDSNLLLMEPQNNTLESFVAGFDLNMALNDSVDIQESPLLRYNSSGNQNPTVEERKDQQEFESIELMTEYIQQVNDVLFSVSKTSQAYLSSVLQFRERYGFEMKVLPGCPKVFAELIHRCTRQKPDERPTFAELSQLLAVG
eukprot:CAMPEP_0182441168 /NCGR_PEP_ID=MMETSP1172-20130603/118_1 /TAXON_ID=708627 /ORGANISM="Timspurckia oligopyrenoides, Strain CCMP3278" /LENGTH=837 /DNA_ID=CAMNT_0024635331 /DNA_START=130 /DNA_END=2643 /DNA_ORIENTATION=-